MCSHLVKEHGISRLVAVTTAYLDSLCPQVLVKQF